MDYPSTLNRPAEAARNYLASGWRTVPIPPGQKGPKIAGWPSLRLTDDEIPARFGDGWNVGLILGEASRGLCVVDSDCPEAIALADSILPHTNAACGRASTPGAHRFYIAEGVKTQRFNDPETRERTVELLSTGTQVLVWPSIHPSGEKYEMMPAMPATVDANTLRAAVEQLHEAVVRQRYGADYEPKPAPVPTSVDDPRRAAPVRPRRVEQVDVLGRARAYLAKMEPSISGAGGHNAAFAAACRMAHGFELDEASTYDLLCEFNERCEPRWSEKELRHKAKEAVKETKHKHPRGHLLHADRLDYINARGTNGTAMEPMPGPVRPEPVFYTVPVIEASFIASVGRVVFWQDGFHLYRDGAYIEVSDKTLSSYLSAHVRDVGEWLKSGRDGVPEIHTPHLSRAMDGNVKHQLIRHRHDGDEPAWLGELDGRPPSGELLACSNSLVHVPSGETHERTSDYFTLGALPYAYRPAAECPLWLAFLADVMDADSVQLLRRWFGYVLMGDTSRQTMLMLIGPTRSGKGVIARVLNHVIGSRNVCAPTLATLADRFGMEVLIGKRLAVFSDVRLSRRADTAVIVERILSITGEDRISIDRKNRAAWTGQLPTRLMFLANELPELPDAAKALYSRLLMLELPNSFKGREDWSLSDKLRDEAPGILNWSIGGWHELQAHAFEQPASGKHLIEEMTELSSPVGTFVGQCCEVRAELGVKKSSVYEAWCQWADDNGFARLDSGTFGKRLRAELKDKLGPDARTSDDDGRAWAYRGLGLNGEVSGMS